MLLDILAWSIVALAAIGVAAFLWAPLHVARHQVQPMAYRLVPVSRGQLHPDQDHWMTQARYRMLHAGFDPVAIAYLDDGSPVDSLFELFRHESEPIWAYSALVSAEVEDFWHFVDGYVETATRFEDGRIVSCNSARTKSPFPDRPGDVAVQLTDAPPKALIDVHRAILRHTAGTPAAPLPTEVDAALARFAAEMADDGRKNAARGFLRPDPERGVYRFTYVGAMLTTYSVLPPFRDLYARYRDWRAQRTLHRLGL